MERLENLPICGEKWQIAHDAFVAGYRVWCRTNNISVRDWSHIKEYAEMLENKRKESYRSKFGIEQEEPK